MAEASFRMSTDAMSPGLRSLKLAPITPSTTTRGWLLPCSELPPRTRMRIESEPGAALVVWTWRPGTSPAIAWSARATGLVSISLLPTEETEPVTSFLN
ncbi:MAG: hypothetical protein AUG88_06845 [Actinobacteria bacterium 13_1_20CM_4_68_12]|nr:MAG: hypothetical protein AUG88_06845 [Actinobacteria bacterium 13_1_20CM_4_68_12]